MPIGHPAATARCAASSQQLRISPPVSSKRSARTSRSTSAASGRPGLADPRPRARGDAPGSARELDYAGRSGAGRPGRCSARGWWRGSTDPVVALEPLQQVGGLEVGVAVVRVARPRSAARRARRPRRRTARRRVPSAAVEEPLEVLLGLADVLARSSPARSTRKTGRPERVGDDARGHRLAGAGGALEQGDRAAALVEDRPEPPVIQHFRGRRLP